jgi:hypothetical protein
MAQVNQMSVWRAKAIVYYDVTANKAFVCKRSWKELISKFFLVLGLVIEVDLKYNKAKLSYQQRGNEIKNLEFWNRYLDLKQ